MIQNGLFAFSKVAIITSGKDDLFSSISKKCDNELKKTFRENINILHMVYYKSDVKSLRILLDFIRMSVLLSEKTHLYFAIHLPYFPLFLQWF